MVAIIPLHRFGPQIKATFCEYFVSHDSQEQAERAVAFPLPYCLRLFTASLQGGEREKV
jgi:hypothetical protein